MQIKQGSEKEKRGSWYFVKVRIRSKERNVSFVFELETIDLQLNVFTIELWTHWQGSWYFSFTHFDKMLTDNIACLVSWT